MEVGYERIDALEFVGRIYEYIRLAAAGADDAVLKLKSLEAFEKAADGQATKIIIPSEIQNMAGVLASARELLTEK